MFLYVNMNSNFIQYAAFLIVLLLYHIICKVHFVGCTVSRRIWEACVFQWMREAIQLCLMHIGPGAR